MFGAGLYDDQETDVFAPAPCPFRDAMRRLGYAPQQIAEALDWLDERSTTEGCPSVEPRDVEAIDRAYGDLVDADAPPALTWPDWCDAHRDYPTAEERGQAAASSPFEPSGLISPAVAESIADG